MFGGVFNFFNHDKRREPQNKFKMQSKSAMSEDYKRAKHAKTVNVNNMLAKELIGLDISEAYKKLTPWWVLGNQVVNNGVGHYTFVRAIKGVVELYTENNKIYKVYPEDKEI